MFVLDIVFEHEVIARALRRVAMQGPRLKPALESIIRQCLS